jgi:hypothetical protein
MWSFRKEIHKISSIGKLGTPINCDTPLDVTGNSGIYLLLVELGTDTGIVNINYEAFNVPDRFQVFWGDTVNPVADTKYVGDRLADDIGDLLNTFTLDEKEYDGNRFINNGSTTTITNTNSDIADGSSQEPTSGSGTIIFIKDSATPTQVLIKVIAPLGGTAWNATVFCPRPIPDQIAEGDCEDFNPSTANWEDIYLDVTPQLLSIGDTIYTDPEKTNKFIGRSRISYRVRTNPITGSSDLVDRVFSVNGDGEVTDLQECTVEENNLRLEKLTDTVGSENKSFGIRGALLDGEQITIEFTKVSGFTNDVIFRADSQFGETNVALSGGDTSQSVTLINLTDQSVDPDSCCSGIDISYSFTGNISEATVRAEIIARDGVDINGNPLVIPPANTQITLSSLDN